MTDNRDRIYLSPPHIGDEERRLVADAFESNWIAPVGSQIDAFEREMGALIDCPHCVAVTSGTAALHLALIELGLQPGDEVLCASLTFVASANPIVYAGAKPVFIDSERRSWNLDPELLAEVIDCKVRAGKAPKAVMAVDLYGHCADYSRIVPVCERYGIPLIEDAAEAVGARFEGQYAGTFGALGAFSFNGNKVITTGGGGMVICRTAEHAREVRRLASQARVEDAFSLHDRLGFNYRLSNVLAAIGRGQLRKLSDRIARRRRIAERYAELFASWANLEMMDHAPYGESNYWLTCVSYTGEESFSSEEVAHSLNEVGVEVRPIWRPLHMQPYYAGAESHLTGVSEDLYQRSLCLPSGSQLTEAQQERVVESLRQFWPKN